MLSKSFNRLVSRSAKAGMLAALALIVVAAFGATSSNAAFTAPYTVKCTGSDVTGRGASFQTILQPALINWWTTSSTSGQTGGCGPAATQVIAYQPQGSGAGRAAFGAGVGVPRNKDIRYIGTDEAPTPTQRTQMEAANPGDATNPATGAGKLAIAPIASGATTVIVHFPKWCELAAGDPDLAPYARIKVSNDRLEQVWQGDAAHDTWGEFLPGIQAQPNNPGSKTDQDCQDQAIKRVKRFDSSGTTFSFKQYLDGINPTLAPTTWLALANQSWPNPGPNLVDGGANGAGALANKVKVTDGSIGYADLATARANSFQKAPDAIPSPVDPAAYEYNNSNAVVGFGTYNYRYTFDKSLFWLPLEQATAASGPFGSGVYSEPTNTTEGIRNNRKGANCVGVTYNNVPHVGGNPANPIDQFGDWSTTNGTLVNDKYPLCTLTYVGFWQDYSDVYGTSAVEQAKARTVKDYLTTSFYSGQNMLNANDYTPLPTDLKTGSQQAIIDSFWLHP
jgi:ABC-type phosphate transport system substrate-binding protein